MREGIGEEVGDRAAYASIFGLLKPYCSKHLVTYIPYIIFSKRTMLLFVQILDADQCVKYGSAGYNKVKSTFFQSSYIHCFYAFHLGVCRLLDDFYTIWKESITHGSYSLAVVVFF